MPSLVPRQIFAGKAERNVYWHKSWEKKGNKTGFLFLLRNIENSRNVLIKSRRLCPPRPAHQKTATIENLYVFVCPILYSVYVVGCSKGTGGGV